MAGRGRPPGSANRRRQEITVRAISQGKTPLEYMIEVMLDPTQDFDRRDKMAIAAAPFIHPRLAAVEHSGEVQTTYVARLPSPSASMDEWQKQHGGIAPSKTVQ